MDWLLIILFFLVAVIYSSAGFGGGSSYIALLVLFGYATLDIKIIAYLCNITVVLITVFYAIKQREINWKLIFLTTVFSIPMSFIGSLIPFEESIFKKILGFFLLLSSLFLLIQPFIFQLNTKQTNIHEKSIVMSGLSGVIGFVAGITGIGGGIFLSPFLLMFTTLNKNKIVSTISIFILFNSLSGLFGTFLSKNIHLNAIILTLLLAVFIGGLIGNYIRIKWIKPTHLQWITAIIVGYAGVKLWVG